MRPNEKSDSSKQLPQAEQITALFLNYQSSTAQDYLDSFCNLVSNDNAKTILELLKLKSKTNWTLGMFIARYSDPATTQKYLTLLQDLINQDLSVNSIFELIEAGVPGGHFSIFITGRKDTHTNQQYLTLLETLINKGLPPRKIFELFSLPSLDDWVVGMAIARNQDATVNQQYLILLETLIKQGVPEIDIFTLFILKTKKEANFGMFVAANQDANINQQYLDFLENLINRTLLNSKASSVDICAFLRLQTQDGWTLGMNIAYYQDSKTTQKYLTLLQTFLNQKASPIDIFALLKLQTQNGWTLGRVIARYRDSETTQQYLRLLSNLAQKGIDVSNLISEISEEKNFSEAVYELLLMGDFSAPFIDYKRKIFSTHLMFLPPEKKKSALISAIDKKTILGKFFWQKNGIRDCALTQGTLKDICEELEIIMGKDKLEEIIESLYPKQKPDVKPDHHTLFKIPTGIRSINGGASYEGCQFDDSCELMMEIRSLDDDLDCKHS